MIQPWNDVLVYCFPTQGISLARSLNLQIFSSSVNATVTQLDVIALELRYSHQATPGNTHFKKKSFHLSFKGQASLLFLTRQVASVMSTDSRKLFGLSLFLYVNLIMPESTSLRRRDGW